MSSQINVDTIVDKAGSGGTNVKVANTSTYVSDGGGATQNTVQGLAKSWASVTVSAVVDSLNVSGLTDNGTGDFTFAYANNMASQDYSTQHFPVVVGARVLQTYVNGSSYIATSSLRINYGYTDNLTGGLEFFDHSLSNFSHHGDLA